MPATQNGKHISPNFTEHEECPDIAAYSIVKIDPQIENE